ncbi:hypothetical protein DOM21_05500 [Bacteriovorax stolpii]|uniref:Uncharacterized protein n=1 Tax=Bacteriovorax stolpii TaxID=960 RepID=A0A2K9NUC2_BACTC|nr:hypothetical protein [Bacteriovorax stolpii]AUN99098.1 hypothetical protein C0V70_13505 [Bacteriovorax stolpii]QDK40920.1 hypothetical protein DOM21_05500 [Bacteriovorax stolpii]TDP55372.1 hypothetical protein C8D79_0420 [Bacteriovorax stolpii]
MILSTIEYVAGGTSSCVDRDEFKIKLSNGKLEEIKSVEWNEGMCKTGRFFMAIPSIIFGSDNHGNDLKCVFDE